MASVPLVEGQAEYNYASDNTNFPNDINEVLEAYVRNNSTTTAPVDTPISKIDRSTYSAIANKLSKGTPSQYYVDRTTTPSIFLYQTPSSTFSGSSYLLKFYYLKKNSRCGSIHESR